MPYSNWNPGQGPNQRGFLFNAGSFEDCGLLDSRDNSRWHDYPCSGGPAFHYAFICQYGISSANIYKCTIKVFTFHKKRWHGDLMGMIVLNANFKLAKIENTRTLPYVYTYMISP